MTKTAWELYREKNSVSEVKNIIKEDKKRDPVKVQFTKKELAPGIFVYQNVFKDTNLIIDEIEKVFENRWQSGSIFSNDDNDPSHIDHKYRDCTVAVLQKGDHTTSTEYDDLRYLLTESMRVCYLDYISYFRIGQTELLEDDWQVLKYGSGQHFDAHADDGFRFPRTVSITSYLNDNYTGGEIEFKNFNLKYKPMPGDVLLFPSNYVYMHKVIAVESGLRYALVNWFRWKTMKVDMFIND